MVNVTGVVPVFPSAANTTGVIENIGTGGGAMVTVCNKSFPVPPSNESGPPKPNRESSPLWPSNVSAPVLLFAPDAKSS